MSTDRLSLRQALAAARETQALEIGPGANRLVPHLFREQFGQRPAVIVGDANTFTAAGEIVAATFREARQAMREPFLFRAPDLHAEHHFATELEGALRGHDAIPVAVGSGTINDLTKLASHRLARPYLCVATAASMDGYTAFGASITHEGLKQTFHCPAPVAVVADLNVVTAAPEPMNSWGYADLLAKFTAGADWIVADALGAEPIDPRAWTIMQGRLPELAADAAGVSRRDPAAVERLMEGLMLGGFAMQCAQSSRPASGAEHQFSHLWDMQQHTHEGKTPSHGFKVGIGMLAVAALYEQLLKLPLDRLDVDRCCAAWVDADHWCQRAAEWLGDERLARGAARELRAKHCSAGTLRAQLETLREIWPDLRQRVRAQLPSLPVLKRKLQEAGAPTAPEEIGISRARLRRSYWQAYCIRRRFTVLDLAARAGVLAPCLERLFGADGLWPAESRKGAEECPAA